MERKYSRKKFFIDKKFQGRFILTFVLISLAGMCLSVMLFNWLAIRQLETLKWKAMMIDETVADLVSPYLIYVNIFAVLFTAFTLLGFLKFLRWKISRSIHKLQKGLVTVRDGNFTLDIKMREGYLFQDVSEDLDKMISSLRERLQSINGACMPIRHSINILPYIKEELLLEKCVEMRAMIRELRERLK